MSVYQLRTYTIRAGMMESWLTLFNTHIRPLHKRLGIPIKHCWVSKDGQDFIWVRQFNNESEIPSKEDSYRGSPERVALGNLPQQHIEQMHVRVMFDTEFDL